jgi:exonuclease VII large subunit
MALDPKSAQDLLNKLKEIERLSKELGKNINLVNLQPIEENVGAIEALFKSLNIEAKQLGEDTEYLISNFRELVSQTKNYSQGLNASTKSFRSLTDISEKLNFSQRGLNNLTTKDLKTLQERTTLEKIRLKSAQDTLQNEMLLEKYSAENLKNDKIAYNQHNRI